MIRDMACLRYRSPLMLLWTELKSVSVGQRTEERENVCLRARVCVRRDSSLAVSASV